jgi:maltose O-acetyltransferase
MERIRLKAIGIGCRICQGVSILDAHNLVLGDNVHIMPGCFINARGGGVTIGDNTHLARNVTIYSYSHNYAGTALPYDDTGIDKPVNIGRNCWLGMNVNVIPGVTIGEGAIIQMGTTVTKDVPPLAIVGMQREHIIKYRDREHYEKLDKENAYGGMDGVRCRK